MNEKDKASKRVDEFIKKRAGGRKKTSQAVVFDMTDLRADMKKISDELLMKVCPTAVGYAGTIVRRQIMKNIKSGGGENHIGMSKKTSSRTRSSGQKSSYATRSKWSKALKASRGNSPSMGEKGTIIKKNISRKAGGLLSSQIVGPKYSGNQSDPTAKNFAHVFEPKEGQASGAPNHKWWPKKRLNLSTFIKYKQAGGRTTGRRGAPMKPMPFVEPAAKETFSEQEKAMIKALKRWDIDTGEIEGTTSEF